MIFAFWIGVNEYLSAVTFCFMVRCGRILKDVLTRYRRLLCYFAECEHLMPGHTQPWLDKGLLPETLAGAERVVSGQAEPEDIIDPWNRRLKQYSFGRFAITTRQ